MANKNTSAIIVIVCEGKTEALYFSILKKRFRLPTYIKIVPNIDSKEYAYLGQHEKLIKKACILRDNYCRDYDIPTEQIELWAVCDRDNYPYSFTKLDNFATERNINLAFSDPQFENYLLQHFSQNKSANKGHQLEQELSQRILATKPQFGLYRKNDLSWLDEMIDERHAIVKTAAKNASVFSNHTKQPFFTIQNLVNRLLSLIS